MTIFAVLPQEEGQTMVTIRIEVTPDHGFDQGWERLRRTRDLLRPWLRRASSRRQLLELDDHMLGDIGLTRRAAHEEACKPFWRR
jgi:uncharacterized protein YjiS (DUF1127 family)